MVEALGPEVSNLRAGDQVSFAGESYASHAVVPGARLIRIPAGISFEQAAAGMNQGFLAYAFTHFADPIKAGEWCLIQAAAGGLGLLLCQMAKVRGGLVIGVTSNAEKAEFVKAAGAEAVITSTRYDAGRKQGITEGRGVSVVYDGVGKDRFAANLDSLAPGGYLLIYGQSGGYVPPFDLMTLEEKGSLFLTRTNRLPYLKEYPHYLELFVEWMRQGKLSIKIDRTYPWAEAARAHAAFAQRQVSGRILLLP